MRQININLIRQCSTVPIKILLHLTQRLLPPCSVSLEHTALLRIGNVYSREPGTQTYFLLLINFNSIKPEIV